MMRISTRTGCAPPTRSITRSWMARSSFACRRTSISEISSSSSVPPCASSNLPMRRATAPVKAPFSCPNSSDSRRLSGIAAQLTETKALSLRRRFGVHVTGQHFLAGAALAGDQDRRLRARDLLGELDDALHGLVAPHERAAVGGDRLEHRGNEVGVGRQRDVFAWRRPGWRRPRRARRCRFRRRSPACGCARRRAPRRGRAPTSRRRS